MAKYNNHTVNNNQRIVLFSRGAGDNKQNVFTGPTSAFTLNGKVRSRSYIGKTYQMSNILKKEEECRTMFNFFFKGKKAGIPWNKVSSRRCDDFKYIFLRNENFFDFFDSDFDFDLIPL